MEIHDDDYRRIYKEIWKVARLIEQSSDHMFCVNASLMCESNAIKTGLCGFRNKLAAHLTKMWSACALLGKMRAAELSKVIVPRVNAQCTPDIAKLIGLRR